MIKSELIQKIAEENPHLFQRDVERIGHVRPGRHAHRRFHRSRTTLDRTQRCDRAPRIGPTHLTHGPNALGRPYHPGHSRPARGRCPVYRGLSKR